MPFTRELVVTQTVIGLTAQVTGLSEERIFTHLSLEEQGVKQAMTHLLLLIFINDEFGLRLAYEARFRQFSVQQWVSLILECEVKTAPAPVIMQDA